MFAQKPQLRTKPTRSAFSLVELLVVMAIIGILAGLSFVLLGQSGKAAREASTKTGIQVIQTILDERIRGFENITQSMTLADPDLPQRPELREFRKRVQEFVTRYNDPASGNGIAIQQQEAEVLVRKWLFKSAFPQREIDLYGLDGTLDNYSSLASNLRDDSPLLARMWDSGISDWAPGSWKQLDKAARDAAPTDVSDDDRAESSELLYIVLTKGDVFGLPPANLDSIDQNLIGDTDDDDNLELLDGWGKPLQFYNWPTRLFNRTASSFGVGYDATDYANASVLVSGLPRHDSGTASRGAMFRDPDDNAGTITRRNGAKFGSNFNLKYRNSLQVVVHTRVGQPFIVSNAAPFPMAIYHDPDRYHVPMIISSGPDESLGIALPNDTSSPHAHLGLVTTQDEIFDNITNRQKGPQ
ncbi:MAG: type II secretion system protein [Planctomycetota bacterium]|nr:MAG: type II secretion system protein [Planctomycetota bacterium]